jgi:hypothetical protein
LCYERIACRNTSQHKRNQRKLTGHVRRIDKAAAMVAAVVVVEIA